MEELDARDSRICQTICAMCKDNLISHINYSRYHGVCKNHQQLYGKKLRCIHCCSEVNYILNEPLNCDNCSRSDPVYLQACSHKLCEACLNLSKNCRKCNPYCTGCGKILECSGNTCNDCLSCVHCKKYPKNLPGDYCTHCYNECTFCGEYKLIEECKACNRKCCITCLSNACTLCSEGHCPNCRQRFCYGPKECKKHYICTICNDPYFIKNCPICTRPCCKCSRIFIGRDLSQFSCGHECCTTCKTNPEITCQLCPSFKTICCYKCGGMNKFTEDAKVLYFKCVKCNEKICQGCGSSRSKWSLGLHRCSYSQSC